MNDDETWSCSDATEDLMGDLGRDTWDDADFSNVTAYLGVPSDRLAAQW